MRLHPSKHESGVALVTTVIVIAVLAVVAVAFMQSTTSDRFSSRSVVNYTRAKLAAEAGLAMASAILATNTTNDTFIIVANTNNQLFVGNGISNSRNFSYRPLFSVAATLTNPAEPIVTGSMPSTNAAGGFQTNFIMPGGLSVASPVVSWIYMTNTNGATNARFAFWVEDLSGKLDLSVVGTNTSAPAARRPTGTNAGEIALWSLFANVASAASSGGGGNALVAARSNILTPASARIVDPAVTPSMLADIAANLQHDTNEPEVVPFGFAYADEGKPKYNLNTNISSSGVSTIAAVISANLPQFAQRAGGYTNSAGGGALNAAAYTPQSFLQTIAANIVDYADADSNPTTDGTPLAATRSRPAFRGVDSYPFVNELNKRYVLSVNAITNFGGVSGRGIVVETTDFVEVWNPSSRSSPAGVLTFLAVHGQSLNLGFLAASFASPTWASNSTGPVTGGITTNQLNIPALQPNSFRVLACSTVTNFFFVPSTNPLTAQLVQEATNSSFHVAWNGVLVDAALGGMLRNQGNLNLGNPVNRSQLPAFIYRVSAAAFGDPSLGDPRSTIYMSRILDANAYAVNSTFGGRNRRAGTVAPTQPFFEVSPKSWPDSGHDSVAGAPAGADAVLPTAVAAAAYSNLPPARISNDGAFSNVAELGAIFDPIQWREPSLLAWQGRWTNLTAGAVADNGFGGGNTLRIGRAEHPRFTNDGLRAAQLLDLFAVGPTNGAGSVIRATPGRININTAGSNALVALAAGVNHISDSALQPLATNYFPPVTAVQAFAQGVTNFRAAKPFYAVSQLPSISTNGSATEWPTNSVFGNSNVGAVAAWNDAAAEEWFAKIHGLATVRSRNFLVHVVGESLATNNLSGPITAYRLSAQIYVAPMRTNGSTTNSTVRIIQSWGL
jgi:hypothetical protein